MGKIIVVVGSVTTAARLEKILRKRMGIASNVIHTPAQISSGGCSYSLRSNHENLSYIKEAARVNKIRVRGFYVEDTAKGEKEYYAIS